MRDRGYTLVEVVIVVAILALIAAASWSLYQGGRAFGTRSAAAQFDAALAYAQALAANSGNGATMVFAQLRSTDGSAEPGFVLITYSGRPTSAGALVRAPLAPMTSIGDVREAKLGGVPFTIFLNGAGHASGMSGTVNTGTIIASDPGCPAGETSVVLAFSDSRETDTRTIACKTIVSGSPIALGTAAP